MKNLKKAGIILLIISIIMSFINITPITMAETYEQYMADKVATKLKKGDEILFDNSIMNWDNVYIYIWQKNSSEYKSWNNADAMTKIEGTNIYKFVVPNDDAFDEHNYNQIIFKNGNSGNQNQTIDLGYIESGLCYKVTESVSTDWDSNGKWIKDKRIGYWYLYDKTVFNQHLQEIIQYQQNKALYTDESYDHLDDLIAQATSELESEIKLEAYKDNSGNDMNLYYLTIATTLNSIDNLIENLKIFEGNINIQTDENGSVTTNQTDNSKVEVGTEVTLQINPNQNYELNQVTVTDQYGNNVSLDSNNTFTMPKSNVTVDASFKEIQRSIITTSENGSVTTNQADDSKVTIGETVVLTLTPNQWHELEALTVTDESGNDIPVTNNTFTMPGSNVTVNAKYKEMNLLHDIIINETENGSVVTDVGPQNVRVGTHVNITITPNYGYELDTIVVTDDEGNDIEVENYAFSMPITDVRIAATFKHINKSITLTSTEGGSIITNQVDNSKVNVGETVELTLTPNTNYELDELIVTDGLGNDVTVSNNTFVMPNSNVNVNAIYRHITKAITISKSANGTTNINVENPKKVNAGEEVKITAEPNDEYEVQEIIVTDEEGNIIEVSSDNTFIMPVKNVIITTIFKSNKTNSNNNDNNSENNSNNNSENNNNNSDNNSENNNNNSDNNSENNNNNNDEINKNTDEGPDKDGNKLNTNETDNEKEDLSDGNKDTVDANKGISNVNEKENNNSSYENKANESNEDNNTNNNLKSILNTPKTGDKIVIVISILIATVAIFVISNRKKKNSKH